MKESHFLSKNVFWENAVRYLRNGEMLELSTLCHCVQHPWKLTGKDFWSSRNKRKWLFKHKCVLKKCCGESQKWWMLELSNLCHCVQHLWKPASRDFWSSRNRRKWLSKQKCVLSKCCGVSQNMVNADSFQTFATVFSTPENLLVGISGALEMKGQPLSKHKCVLRKCCGVSQIWWDLTAFKPFSLCSAPLKTY